MRRLFVLTLLVLTALAYAAPSARRVEGKTAAQWLQLLRTNDDEQWDRAAYVLMMHGDELVGPLTAALGDADARVRRGAARGLRQLTSFPPATITALRKRLTDPDLAVRAEVVETLLYADDYDAAIPEALRSILSSQDAELREGQAYVLHILPLDRKPYLDLVLETLHHPEALLRTQAAEALRYERELPEAATAALRALLSDPVTAVRLEAAASYWTATEEAPPLLDLLLEALKTAPAAEDRAAAAGILGEIGERASAAFPALAAAALGDPEADVRKAAAGALASLHAAPDLAVPVFVQIMEDRRGAGWEGALTGLVGLGPAAVPALHQLLPQLLLALRGEHIFSSTPRLAAEAVGMIGPAAHAAVPLLVRLANLPYQSPYEWPPKEMPAPEPRTSSRPSRYKVVAAPQATPEVDPFSISASSAAQEAAVAALARVATPAEALPHLLKALASKDADLVTTAAKAIGSLGPAAKPALVPLIHAIVTENDKVCYAGLNEALFRAIIAIEPKALPGNLVKIAQKRPAALWELVPLMAEIPDPEDYLAPLIKLVQHPGAELATASAARLLAALKARAPEAAEALGKLLADKDPHLQVNVGEALRAMGPAALPALPHLLAGLKSKDEFRRVGAIGIVEAIGPGAASAAPALLDLVRNPKLESLERVMAAWAAHAVGAAPAELVEPLQAVVDAPADTCLGGAAELLGEIGPPAAATVPSLRRRLAEAQPYARVQVARALWRLTGTVEEVLPAVSEVAKGELGPGKLAAALLLREIGPAAATATPLLRELLNERATTVRIAAALALAEVTGDDSGLAATVLAALQRPGPDFMDEAMLLMLLEPGLQAHGTTLVGPITKALSETKDEAVQVELIVFLPLLGEAAKAAVPELEKLTTGGTEENPGAAALQAVFAIRSGGGVPDFSRLMKCMGDDMPWKFPTPD